MCAMLRQRKKWWIFDRVILFMACPVLFLTGCGHDVYGEVSKEVEQVPMEDVLRKVNLSAESYRLFVNRAKLYAPFVIVISISVGIVLGIITQNAKAVRKRVYSVFVIAIPLITFLFVYGISGMYAKFFG